MEIANLLGQLFRGGAGNLAAYMAAHVLLCLVPAFFIAGAMTALIPKQSITRFLGRSAPKVVSFPAAALAGSVLAVCSCTIVPLFAGIYKKGAGLGPAITFLFFAPAANILALVYTGGVIGVDLAIARLVLSLLFGIGIGLIMALIFRREDQAHDAATNSLFAGGEKMKPAALAFLLVLVALLLAGTLKVPLLTQTYAEFTLPLTRIDRLQDLLYSWVPFDASKGEEGVTAQGAFLIGFLILIGLTAWRGLEHVTDGITRWSWVALSLVGLTLVVASVGMTPTPDGLIIAVTGKAIGVLLALFMLAHLMRRFLSEQEVQDWMWESWRFVKQIFPLLVVGVFAVGMIRVIIRPEWIEMVAGENTLRANLAGVLFGVFMYFPTLVEVPIANMFLDLGMHRGPLLAYLMADPELSLQSILIVSAIIGRGKAWTYVAWVALFSTLAGLIYGGWIDGVPLAWLSLILAAVLGTLALTLWMVNRHNAHRPLGLGASHS